MEHFYRDIPGWFSYDYIYKEMVEVAEDGDVFVEIGSFKGRSSAFMAVEIANSGKKIKFDCIDPFELLSHYAESAKGQPEIFEGYSSEDFLKRMEPANGHFNMMKMTSAEAAKLYANESIDFIMIDGDHEYEAVKADIQNFLPKMKKGAIMTGDDAFSPEILRAAQDALPGLNVQLINGIHWYVELP
jgi:predicted O-methyltransferase YrrM